MLPGSERISDCVETYNGTMEKYFAAKQEIKLLKDNLYILNLDTRIQELEDILHNLESDIKQQFSILSHAIATVPNKKHREILEDAILYRMPRVEIAANIGYSYRHTCELISVFCHRRMNSFEDDDYGAGI